MVAGSLTDRPDPARKTLEIMGLRECPKAFSFLPIFAILRTLFCSVCRPGAHHRPKAS